MMTVAQPGTTGQLSKYHQKDDYYLKEKGEWQGRGAEILGLTGEVKPEDFHAVLDGKHPETGVQLRPRNGEKIRAGLDLVFSAPKSVSILALGDKRIKELHDQAVKTSLEYIEKHNVQAREQNEGVRRALHTGKAVFAKFDHLTSREMDPQLHTHSVLMNLTQTDAGKWKAIHNDSLFFDQVKLGQIYRNEFANLLQKDGYAIRISDRKEGFFDIVGVDENLIEKFSSRRAQVIAKVEEYKASGKYADASEPRLFELAALGSRAAKPDSVDKALLKETWLETIYQSGNSLQEMLSASKMSSRQREAFEKSSWTDHHLLRASRLITDHEAVFPKIEIVSETARLSLGKNSLSDIEASFKKLQTEGPIINLGERESSLNSINYFSTKEMMAIENEIVNFVNASKNKYTPSFSQTEIDTFLDKQNQKRDWRFTDGQRKSVHTILTSPDQVNIIQGDAGTGKTTYLEVVKELSEQKNMSVLGVGFTGKSAASLKQIGIEAMTINALLNQDIRFVEPRPERISIMDRIASFLKSEKKENNFSFEIEKGSTLIIDEASMTGNKQIFELLKLADKGNLKVIIQGDKKQLPSISAGRMHDILQHKTHVEKVFLNESVRQKKLSDAHENIKAFHENGLEGVLENLNDQGNVIHFTRKDVLIDELRNEFLKERQSGSVLVLVDQNELRERLNKKLREALVNDGKVSGKGFTLKTLSPASITSKDSVYANSYAEGQQILLHEKTGDFEKGSYEISEIDNTQNVIRLKDARGKIKPLITDHHGEKISAYDVAEKQFSKGDKIVFLKNDRRLGVENGNIGLIEKIDRTGNLTVKVSGKTITFSTTDDGENLKYNYIDHGYAVTVHKSQGSTVDRTIYLHDSSSGIPSANSLYVAMTRSRQSTKIFTQSQKLLKKHSDKWIEKTSTLDDYEHKNFHVREFLKANLEMEGKGTSAKKDQDHSLKINQSKENSIEIEM
ncbi:MAG: relaxase domain-containing protein [Proteobacteria bacterium]|nr:relaxase domain-containing protein [Pseudomonadota bacterium]